MLNIGSAGTVNHQVGDILYVASSSLDRRKKEFGLECEIDSLLLEENCARIGRNMGSVIGRLSSPS